MAQTCEQMLFHDDRVERIGYEYWVDCVIISTSGWYYAISDIRLTDGGGWHFNRSHNG